MIKIIIMTLTMLFTLNLTIRAPARLTHQERFIEKMLLRTDSLDTDIPKSIIIAQACIETGYGKKCPGYNLFGMTGRGPDGSIKRKDSDWVKGKRVSKWKRFKAYHNYNESIEDFIEWYYERDWFNKLVDDERNTVNNILWYLERSNYATDPNYVNMIKGVIKRYNL